MQCAAETRKRLVQVSYNILLDISSFCFFVQIQESRPVKAFTSVVNQSANSCFFFSLSSLVVVRERWKWIWDIGEGEAEVKINECEKHISEITERKTSLLQFYAETITPKLRCNSNRTFFFVSRLQFHNKLKTFKREKMIQRCIVYMFIKGFHHFSNQSLDRIRRCP